MKKICWGLTVTMIFLASCQDKAIDKLARKWDCIKVDNLDKVEKKYESPEDSLMVANLSSSLKALSWTFTKNNEYLCSVDGQVTTQGTFELDEEEKTMICTSNTKNNINRYSIITLTDNQLVLGTVAGNTNLLLHFSPH